MCDEDVAALVVDNGSGKFTKYIYLPYPFLVTDRLFSLTFPIALLFLLTFPTYVLLYLSNLRVYIDLFSLTFLFYLSVLISLTFPIYLSTYYVHTDLSNIFSTYYVLTDLSNIFSTYYVLTDLSNHFISLLCSH